MKAHELAKRYSIDELVAMRREIVDDPANQQDGFHLYTPQASAKLDEIAWAITYHLRGDAA